MLWREFSPYVLPYVIGCPIPVLEHHMRLAAIDWCRKTLSLQRDLDPVLADGTTHAVAITPPAGYTTIRALAVAVAGKERELVTDRIGQQFSRTDHPGDFCFTRNNLTLEVYPLEVVGVDVVVTAALMPSLGTSPGIDDDVALEYANDIALCAIASIKRLPIPELADPAGAIDHQTRYESRRSTVAAKVTRGLSAAKTRTPTKFF